MLFRGIYITCYTDNAVKWVDPQMGGTWTAENLNVPSHVCYIQTQFIFKIIEYQDEGEISSKSVKKKHYTTSKHFPEVYYKVTS